MYAPLAHLSLEEQRSYQSRSLEKLLGYLHAYSPYYKKLFLAYKIAWEKIKTLEDLVHIPTTDKNTLQNNNWDFLCVAKNEIREYTATSGTLGKPVTLALNANDLKRLAYNEEQSFLCTGAAKEDIYQLMLTLDRQFMAGMAYYSGLGNIGASVIRTGPGLPAMQWETIARLQTTGIVAVPGFIIKLIEYAKANAISLNDSPVKKAVCIGDNLRNENFELNALGSRIRADWNMELYNTYASTEMQTAFTECRYGKGGHEQAELILTEILDEAGNQLNDGEYGEVTITTLGVEGMPLLRYRTGDVACMYSEPCRCGRFSRRISPVKGRKQQMIKYKGTTLYPPALFDTLNSVSFINEYAVEVKKDELGSDELTIFIEAQNADMEFLKNFLQSCIRVTPQIINISAQQMQQLLFPQSSRKPQRFIDNR